MIRHYQPLHEVQDAAKVESLVEAFRTGQHVPAIAVAGDTALTGTHRIAAFAEAWDRWNRGDDGWDIEEPTLDTVEVSDEDYRNACELIGLEHHTDTRDYNLFIAALHAVTEDDALKAAIADQCYDYEGLSKTELARYA